MNRSYLTLPTYTGDVSGACSALYELGGMVVIHDPSGCNSTYNTHDETRWYDQDSLVFITGLTERDAILGNDQKLVDDVADAAAELNPRFVALCNSPIPFISGTDFAALCRLIERRTGIPCFYVRTNGMHDYTVGAGNSLACVARRFVLARTRKAGTLNILGVTPLDFLDECAPADLRQFARDAGFEPTSCWAMGDDLDALCHASEASVNLVVSATGMPAARVLRERFGTPYVLGVPYGPFAPTLAEALKSAAETAECLAPCRDVRTPAADGVRVVVGEPVAAGSLAAARELMGEPPLRVISPLEGGGEALAPTDLSVYGEREVEAALHDAHLVVADELYGSVCPRGAALDPWPHLALSGRNSRGQVSTAPPIGFARRGAASPGRSAHA